MTLNRYVSQVIDKKQSAKLECFYSILNRRLAQCFQNDEDELVVMYYNYILMPFYNYKTACIFNQTESLNY